MYDVSKKNGKLDNLVLESMKTKGPRHDVEMWDRIVSDVRTYDI
jgi:hypothetical protein